MIMDTFDREVFRYPTFIMTMEIGTFGESVSGLVGAHHTTLVTPIGYHHFGLICLNKNKNKRWNGVK